MLDSKLNSLLVLSATNSITKTAEIVHHTQPAVTSQIKSLEEEYGIKIFNKKGNNIEITPQGHILIKYANKIRSDYDALIQELQTYETKIQILKVGVTSGMGSTFISEVLAKFAAKIKLQNNDFKVILIYDSSKKLHEKLAHNELACIISDDQIIDQSFKKIPLDEGQLICIVSPNNILAQRQTITLDELKNYNLLIRFPSTSIQILFDAILRTHNLSINDLNILMELNSISAIKNLIKQDIAVSVLPDTSCHDELESGQLIGIPIEDVTTPYGYYIYYKNETLNEDFIKEINNLYSQLKFKK